MADIYSIEEAGRKLEQLDRLARMMDDAVKIPGTNFGVGLDGLIGLLPGVGDLVSAGIALHIVYEGRKIAPGHVYAAVMLANVVIDALIGVVPAVGDIFDFAFRANLRNIAIIRKGYEARLRDEHGAAAV